MKNLFKSMIITGALLLTVGAAQADEIVVYETFNPYYGSLEPGYAEMIDEATVWELDEAVAMFDEFDQPNLFMSDEGVYRYAFYDKTGIWLEHEDAEEMVEL